MSLPIVPHHNLVPLISIMKDTDNIFIIPTFQRPFSWETEQLEDLQKDIDKTHSILSSNPSIIHYLAPIHLIKITPSLFSSTAGSLNVENYLSEDNKDITSLCASTGSSGFVDYNGDPLNVYFVIDGQQRLTTLFFVYQFLYKNSTGSNPLFIRLKNGNTIPRLIQNPSNDHQHFKTVLNSLTFSHPINTQAQKRMNSAVDIIRTWTSWNTSSPTSFMNFLRNPALRTLLIELDPIYGLTSFQTLNDRGKDLTPLEKFKSLLFEYDLNYNSGSLTNRIHTIFSDLYQMLDEGMEKGLFPEKESDDRLMKYIFTYIKIEADSKNYDHSGDNAYNKFRNELKDSVATSTTGSLLKDWLDRIKEVCEQLQHLNDCLSGNEPTVNQSSFICPNRTIQDDYKIIIRSLKLSDRSIAVLIKFRALHNVEWHDRFSINCTFTPILFEPLKKYLNECRGEKSDNKEAILKQIDELRFPDAEEPYSFSRDYSMLQVVERMELLVWKRFNPAGTFHSTWLATFNPSLTGKDTVQTWYGWYSSQQNDFPRFVQNDTNDSCFRYVLREYECYLGSGNIHFDPDLTLEHIFPQNPNPKPPLGCGFVGGDAYNLFLNRIGNLTFVYQNSSMSNQSPQIKTGAYYIAPTQPQITQRVGKQLKAVGINCSDHHQVLLVRCTELALFSIKRFFC